MSNLVGRRPGQALLDAGHEQIEVAHCGWAATGRARSLGCATYWEQRRRRVYAQFLFGRVSCVRLEQLPAPHVTRGD